MSVVMSIQQITIQQLLGQASTMQKKSLDSSIGIQDYNKKLFSKSIELISSCKKIPINQVSNLHRQEGVRKKYNAIEDKLQNILKMLRNFTDTEKPVFNNPIDLASEILEETKLQVQIQFRKAQEQKNTLRVQKSSAGIKKQRPQTRYPNIKTYQNFDEHSHQSYLEDGLLPEIVPCTSAQQPSPITEEYFYVDTSQKLDIAIKEMKQHRELAVDVEHSTKSYEGFTCLIQISTRVKDYIIDVFPIWDGVPALQEVIGNPNILKIMHGAQMDTKWLQRDFNIHIVNLFDTYRAARVLGMPKFSYAYLLHHYCNVTTNKIYQRADWRERPLISQMLKYARMDTHYLLTIFDHLRIDIQKQSSSMGVPLKSVFYDIQKSSHDVTLANAELYSYKTKQMYINLMSHFKDKTEQFKAIESIFSQINYAALREDENFDDLVTRNELDTVISLVKDLTFNQKSKISKQSRIEKIVTTLQKSGFQCLNEAITNIKNTLTSLFCHHKAIKLETKKAFEAPKPQRSQTFIQPQSSPIFSQFFTRTKTQSIKFAQFSSKSFQSNNSNNKKVSVSFLPITSFLSQKYGIEQVKQDDQVMQEEDEDIEQEMEEEINGEKQEQEEEREGLIEFKRINPNVIYTIEQQDPQVASAVNAQKPRKVRRETEYENRIRNQKGNIFDLLGNI